MNKPVTQRMNCAFHSFDSLDPGTLFAFMKLRVDVFVVEQACAYPELDDHDTAPDTLHLTAYMGTQLVAYARAIPTSELQDPVSKALTRAVKIGRVVVAASHRGTGVAQSLMATMLQRLDRDFPERLQILAAQDAVAFFYADLGFRRVSEIYLEDGITHVDMIRTQSASLATQA